MLPGDGYRRVVAARRKMAEMGYEDVFEVLDALAFYRQRVEAIERYFRCLPEPHLTAICNILANGRASPFENYSATNSATILSRIAVTRYPVSIGSGGAPLYESRDLSVPMAL